MNKTGCFYIGKPDYYQGVAMADDLIIFLCYGLYKEIRLNYLYNNLHSRISTPIMANYAELLVKFFQKCR